MPSRPHMKFLALALPLALFGGVFAITPVGMRIERDLGLEWLFIARGPLSAPANVVVVSMDRHSADRLVLPASPSGWPRSVHGRLIDRLSDLNVGAIVFDVHFRSHRNSAGDAALARAIERSGRVVLFQGISRNKFASDGMATDAGVVAEMMISPIAEFSAAAAGEGPFPLPKSPARVDQFWAFKTSADGAPTLPAVALQLIAQARWNAFDSLSRQLGREVASSVDRYRLSTRRAEDLRRLMRTIRRSLRERPESAQRARGWIHRDLRQQGDTSTANILDAVIDLYGGENSYFLNFYGPARTIRTIPYYEVLKRTGRLADPSRAYLDGAVVFVGLSDDTTSSQKEGFYTVFSRDDGIDLSGVEIAATAFANLLNRDSIRPVDGSQSFAIVLLFGLIIGCTTAFLTGAAALVTALVVGMAYAAIAYILFVDHFLWVPLGIPLLVQLPLALIVGYMIQYFAERQNKELARRGMAYLVPELVVEEFSAGTPPEVKATSVHGVCLTTDLVGSTLLAQRIGHGDFKKLSDEYYRIVGSVVSRHDGTVNRFSGDRTICTWPVQDDRATATSGAKPCLAALDLIRTMEGFNAQSEFPPIQARIGMHSGWYDEGISGGPAHYEFVLLGDAINIAARIEDLGKLVGGRALASGAVVSDVEGFLLRRLGHFLLRDVGEPMEIFELVAKAETAKEPERRLCADFAAALTLYESRLWRAASKAFDALLSAYPGDGPTRFYCDRAQAYATAPPGEGDAAVIDAT